MATKTSPSLPQLQKIIQDIPTPFHLYDEKAIRKNVRRFHDAFSWNVGFREYFAVKANPNPYILNMLKEEGCGVDCASYTELMLAEACGFSGDYIMFSSNATPAEEYRYARTLGAKINLDDYTHVDFLKECAGIPEFVSLRYNPGGEITIGNSVMGNPGDAKFGMTKEQLICAVKRLSDMGAKRFGLHAFLVSNATDTAYYPMMARMLFELAVEIQQMHGISIELVNLSGGVGIPYHPDEPEADIFAIGAGVKQAFEDVLVPAGLGNVSIATELGRYILGPYGWLISTAIHEKNTHKHYIGLDSSAGDLMRPAMYGAYHHITVAGKEDYASDHVYDVTGSLCENNDKFAIERELPHIDMGDIVVIHDTGAHGHSMGYNYNGKLRSAEVLLCEDGTHRLIRRKEMPADYFSTMDFSGLLNDVIERRG